MVRELKGTKKPYRPPVFEILNASAARLELGAAKVSPDASTRQMLCIINPQLDGMGISSSTPLAKPVAQERWLRSPAITRG